MGSLVGLRIYPVKSMRGMEQPEAVVESRGLKGDRRWMVCDHDGKFLTQRNVHELAQYSVRYVGSSLQINHPQNGLALVGQPVKPVKPIQVWNDTVDAVVASSVVNQWLSKALARPVELCYMPDSTIRTTHQDFSDPGDHVSFADGFPLLLTNVASLDEMNSHLDAHVSVDRFRPNVIVEGFEAWAEESWSGVQIGEVKFKCAKLCGRCIVTTLNPLTGESLGTEPLDYLSKHRLKGQAAIFGVNLIPMTPGVIRMGDIVVPI